jgi:hypothetical protein
MHPEPLAAAPTEFEQTACESNNEFDYFHPDHLRMAPADRAEIERLVAKLSTRGKVVALPAVRPTISFERRKELARIAEGLATEVIRTAAPHERGLLMALMGAMMPGE